MVRILYKMEQGILVFWNRALDATGNELVLSLLCHINIIKEL